jgi:hypothetical protein
MEEQAPFGKPEYELPSYLEKVQTQLPAGLAQAKRDVGSF